MLLQPAKLKHRMQQSPLGHLRTPEFRMGNAKHEQVGAVQMSKGIHGRKRNTILKQGAWLKKVLVIPGLVLPGES